MHKKRTHNMFLLKVQSKRSNPLPLPLSGAAFSETFYEFKFFW